jgi:hypothetical protein
MHPHIILILFASLVVAIPFTSPPFALSPYQPSASSPQCIGRPINNDSGVKYCLGIGFIGVCKHKAYTEGKSCLEFSDLLHRPRAIGPDPGGYCELFRERDCGGEPLKIWKDGKLTSFECPGISEMGGKNEWWMSMKCQKNQN